MRITGLATGLDMDELVKTTMKPYRVKIQVQQQKQEVLEIKQKLYRDVIKDTRDFYNKYFDVSKSDSLLLSKNWATTKFTSSDDAAVSVSAGADAKVGSYTVTGNKATATKAILTEGVKKGENVVINGKEFTFEGENGKEIAKKLNSQLKEAGFDVSVRYSDFAGNNQSGLIFESTTLGSTGTFTIGGKAIEVPVDSVSGKDATKATIEFDKDALEELKKTGVINVGNKEISLDLDSDKEYSNEDITKILNDKLKDIDFTASIGKDNNIVFTSNKAGAATVDANISIGTINGTFKSGEEAESAVSSLEFSKVSSKTLFVNGKEVEVSADLTLQSNLDDFNDKLKDAGVTASLNGDKLVLTANEVGSKQKIDISVVDTSVGVVPSVIQGKDANITIKDGNGGVYVHEGGSNSVTLDGITFNFNGEIPAEGIKITGKTDTTAIKDKLVTFINDYNTVIERLNTLISEKRDSSYMPLTDEQKEAMSDKEIELWEERVEKGQLRRDSDLTRVVNNMKSSMRAVFGDTNLSKFGIKTVDDYSGTKNGTFTVDEEALTKALETNGEDLMNLFIANSNDKKGIGQQLKTVLYDEFITTSSPLIKKAGLEGTASVANNELSKQIEKYKNKIEDMEKSFSVREQALYSKWASIETIMNNLNSQQSNLASMLGY